MALLLILGAACRARHDSPEAAAVRIPPPGTAAIPLAIVSVQPPEGSEITPQTRFEVGFDRPVDPATIGGHSLNCHYPDPRAEFLGDPFRLTAAWLSADGLTASVHPAPLLAGREVRLRIGADIRARDGGVIARDADAPEGLAREVAYRVLELPPP